jgi:3-oxoacyl-[acyl-carrier-protein] synthase II
VTALARGFDASAPAWDYGDGGAALAGVLARAHERAGVGAETLDAVATGASGARRGDRLEAAVLRRIFAGAPPPLVAPKALLGGWGGGHLAASVLLAAGRLEPRPLVASALDPELGLTPRTAAGSPRRWLVSSLASGGAAAWAVLDGRRRSTP